MKTAIFSFILATTLGSNAWAFSTDYCAERVATDSKIVAAKLAGIQQAGAFVVTKMYKDPTLAPSRDGDYENFEVSVATPGVIPGRGRLGANLVAIVQVSEQGRDCKIISNQVVTR